MAKDKQSNVTSETIAPPQAAKDTTPLVRLDAVIAGVGIKRSTIPVADLEATLDKIARIGIFIDAGKGKQTIYLSNRIEKINVEWL